MFNNKIRFTATKLINDRKEGVLKPDEDGYYDLVIGGLNCYNSVGEYYSADGAIKLFQDSNSLMRRIKNGNCRGEVGHPKKSPGMTERDYLNRLLTIEETNICCFYKTIWLDENFGRNNPQFDNPKLIAIRALVKPAGNKGAYLKEALDDKDQNVCFSVRGFTRDYMQRGVTIRVLEQIITWDNVNEPGLHISNKWDSPSLESIQDTFFNITTLEKIVETTPTTLAMEQSNDIAKEVLHSFVTLPQIPVYGSW